MPTALGKPRQINVRRRILRPHTAEMPPKHQARMASKHRVRAALLRPRSRCWRNDARHGQMTAVGQREENCFSPYRRLMRKRCGVLEVQTSCFATVPSSM